MKDIYWKFHTLIKKSNKQLKILFINTIYSYIHANNTKTTKNTYAVILNMNSKIITKEPMLFCLTTMYEEAIKQKATLLLSLKNSLFLCSTISMDMFNFLYKKKNIFISNLGLNKNFLLLLII